MKIEDLERQAVVVNIADAMVRSALDSGYARVEKTDTFRWTEPARGRLSSFSFVAGFSLGVFWCAVCFGIWLRFHG